MPKIYRTGFAVRLVNVTVGWLARRGLGRAYLHILTVRGRTTGQPRSTPVDVMEEGGQRWLVAPYGATSWVRNARASGEVAIRRGGRSETLRIVEVGPDEAVPVLRTHLRHVPITRPYLDGTPRA